MPIIPYKHSLEFLKNLYKNGSQKQRYWALRALRARWTEVNKKWQTILNIFSDQPYPPKHAF